MEKSVWKETFYIFTVHITKVLQCRQKLSSVTQNNSGKTFPIYLRKFYYKFIGDCLKFSNKNARISLILNLHLLSGQCRDSQQELEGYLPISNFIALHRAPGRYIGGGLWGLAILSTSWGNSWIRTASWHYIADYITAKQESSGNPESVLKYKIHSKPQKSTSYFYQVCRGGLVWFAQWATATVLLAEGEENSELISIDQLRAAFQ